MIARAVAAVALVALACGDNGESERNAHPALLPSMMQQQTNADANPPSVPFSPGTPRQLARAVRRWPHDSVAFTQGLVVHDGRLLESTGIEGHSGVREVEARTGRVLRRTDLPGSEFGEGIAVLGERMYQLTWKSGRGRVYDARTLAPIDSFAYEGEGWGLASDGVSLYLSDGTSRIRVIDAAGFRVLHTIQVTEGGRPVWALNELEWVRGELWANVYQTDLVARIDPVSGHVVGWIDLARLLSPEERSAVTARGGVANGIAYDSVAGAVLVTGKYWPYLVQLDSIRGLRPSRSK
ncbi:MAG: glutaminyl-peptide cyclotransferase [bacterium]